jgi:seryl-tRNA synthetase
MLDIKWIRQNPEKFDAVMSSRSNKIKAETILELDEKKRKKTFLIQELQARRNKLAKEIAEAKKDGINKDEAEKAAAQTPELVAESKKVNMSLSAAEADFSTEEQLNEILAAIPNILHHSVPAGKDESNNIEIEKYGTPKKFSFLPKAHDEIGKNLKMLDFDQSALMSGARFSSLSGGLAYLERALANFMLDVALQNGYLEVSPPNIVKSAAMYNSGQLPKFSAEAFTTIDGYWLIPTSEVALVNLVAGKTFNETDLPLRFSAYTPCFRREAGSAGKDTRGMIRQHQFKKVELVAITTSEQSEAEHEKITNIACEILRRLELPFRKILLCCGDTGFCAQKTYDLEVWLPGQEKYREISSCSNCGDFQARRAAIKYKNKSDGKTYFAHTLNGSALAVGRTLIAVMENYQNEDGSVMVPEVLINYMNGTDKISC